MCVDMKNGRITENVFTLVTYNKLMLLSTNEGVPVCLFQIGRALQKAKVSELGMMDVGSYVLQ